MALGRISGQLLKSNLQRDNVDLAFETDLLYLSVTNALSANWKVGIKTSTPQYDLDVNGTTRSTNIRGTNLDIGDLNFYNNVISTAVGNITIQPSTGGRVVIKDPTAQGNLIPDTTLTRDLGSSSLYWNNGYINTLNTANLNVTTGGNVVTDESKKIYVHLNGNDTTGTGKNLIFAYRTLKKALSVATSGTTIVLSPGDYQEIFPLTVPEGVTVKGAGLRATSIYPTVATKNKDAFLLNGETTVEDLTVKDFFYDAVNDTGYGFRFAPNTTITYRSPYVQRVTVINKGSTTTTADPYGFAAGDAGRGALIDGSQVSHASLEAAILFNECTMIVPNSRGLVMTNGARTEWLNCFTYFADLAIEGKIGAVGRGGDGKTYLTLTGKTGTFNVGDTISLYDNDHTTVLGSGLVESITTTGSYVIDGNVSGFVASDSSRVAKIFTANGNAALSTAQKKFGTASLALDGTGDYVTTLGATDFNFGSGAWTIELWVYRTTSPGTTQVLVDFRTTTPQVVPTLFLDTAYHPSLFVNGSAVITGTAVVALDTWTHIAVSKSGTSTKIFVNGTQTGSTYTDTNTYVQGTPCIGAKYDGTQSFNGYFDDLRITKGLGRYTTTFTAPTVELTGDSNTVALLNFNGADGSIVIKDNNTIAQDVRSSSGGTATGITRYDRGEFAAELRAISGANVYGNYGVKADGTDVKLHLMAHNFAYIGTGYDLTNNKAAVIQDNEVVEVNGGRVYYNSVDQSGNYRVGDLFTVDFDTGTVSFAASTAGSMTSSGTIFTDGTNQTLVYPTLIQTGHLLLQNNTISSTTGQIILDPSGSEKLVVNSDTDINGNLNVSGNVVIGGNITIGDADTDSITIVADLSSNLVPDIDDTYDIGTYNKNWRTLYIDNISNNTGVTKLQTFLTTDLPDIELFNDTALVVRAFGAAEEIHIGSPNSLGVTTLNHSLVVNNDVTIKGGDLFATTSSFNLLQAPTTINAFGAATALSIGNATAQQQIDIGTASTASSTYNFATGNTAAGFTKSVNIGTNSGFGSLTYVKIGSSFGGDTTINSGTIKGALTTQNLFNTVTTTLNIGGEATSLNLGATTGTLTINNPTVVGTQPTVNLWNTGATTVNAFGAATTIGIGNATGTTTVKSAYTVLNGDLQIKGGDLTTDQTTFNLLNDTATTIHFGEAGTAISIGANTGETVINNDLRVFGNFYLGSSNSANTFQGTFRLEAPDNTAAAFEVVQGTDGYIKADTTNGSELITFGALPLVTFLNTTDASSTTVAGTTFAGGVGIAKKLYVGSDLHVLGSTYLGDSTSDSVTINGDVSVSLADNTTDAFIISQGSDTYLSVSTTDSSELVTIGNNTVSTSRVKVLGNTNAVSKDTGALVIDSGGLGVELDVYVGQNLTVTTDTTVGGDLAVNGGDITTTASTFNLVNTTATTVNIAGASTSLNLGSGTGTTTVNNALDVKGNVTIDGGSLYVSTTSFSLANSTATSISAFGSATDIQVGSGSGNTTIKNNLVVNQDLQVKGGDITTDQTTFNLLNATASTVNFAGEGTSIVIGATTGTTNVRNNLDVDGDINVDGGDITTSASTFNLLDTTATTLNIGRAATTIVIGSTTGSTTIRNASLNLTGDLAVNGGDITTSATTFNLVNTTATTLNVGGAATSLNLGATTGTATIRNDLLVLNGDLQVKGGDITTDQTAFNLINTTATAVNAFGAASTLSIGASTGTTTVNNDLVVTGDVAVNGGDITSTATTFNLLNTTATTLNIGGAATTLSLGAATGTTSVKNNLSVAGDVAVNGGDITTTQTTATVFNTTATTLSIGGESTTTSIGAASGTTTVGNDLTVTNDLAVNGGDITTTQTTASIFDTTATTVNAFRAGTNVTIGATSGTTTIRNANTVITGDLAINGGDLTSNQTTFNLLNTGVQTINFGGAATTINFGSTADVIIPGNLTVNGTTTTINSTTVSVDDKNIELGSIASPTDITADGGGITLKGTTDKTFNWVSSTSSWTSSENLDLASGKVYKVGATTVLSDTAVLTSATTVSAFTSGTAITIGSTVGTTTIRNANTVVTGDLAVNGGDITTNQSSATVFNANATTVNAFGAATTLNLGAATGTATIKNASVVLDGDLAVNGGDITTTALNATLLNANALTLAFAGDATSITIGSATGTTNIRNNLDVDGDINVDGGDITTSATTFNLVNANATTVNFASDASTINVGAATGTLTLKNANVVMNGDLQVKGGDITTDVSSFNLLNTNATTINLGGAATSLNLGATTGTTAVRNGLSVAGDIAVDGGDITTSQTTASIFDTTATTVNAFRAATTLTMGATSGTTNIRNNLDVDGDVNIDGGDLTVSTTTFNLANTTATTLNVGGAATSVNIGSATGTTTIKNANVVLDGDLAVNGGDITTSQTTATVFNTTATTVNFAGAGTTVNIGASTGTTYVKNNLNITGTTTLGSTVNSNIVGTSNNTNTIGANGTPWYEGWFATVHAGNLALASNTLSSTNTNGNIILGPNGNGVVYVSAVTAFGVPVGSEANKALFTASTGQIRYNTTSGMFEGYSGSYWSSLGGVRSVDGLTYITAESGPGVSDDTLRFYTDGVLQMSLDTNSLDISSTVVNTNINSTATSTSTSSGALVVAGGVGIGENLNVGGTANITGNVTIGGDLVVNGTTTTVNSTTVSVDDKNIELGSVASPTNITADGGGITLKGTTDKTILWVNATGAWTLSEHLNLASGKEYRISSTSVLDASSLFPSQTTVSIAPSGTAITVGATTGTTTVRNNLNVDGNIDTNGTLNADGAATLGSTLNVTGNFSVNTDVFTVNATSGDVVVTGGLDVSGATTLGSTLDVTGDLSVNTDKFVVDALTGDTSIAGNANIGGDLTVIGALTMTGAVSFDNGLTINGSTTPATEYFRITDGATPTATTTFLVDTSSGDTVISGTLGVTGSLGINGATALSGSLTAISDVSLTPAAGTTLIIAPVDVGNIDNVNIGSTTRGSGKFTTLSANGATTFTSGTSSTNSTSGAVVVTGGVGISENLNVGGNLSVSGTLNVTSPVTVASGGTGMSSATVNGIIYGNGTSPMNVTAASNPGFNATTSYGILTTNIDNVPVWTDVIDCGSY